MVVRTMTINCARLADVAFSAPYFKTGQQVLAPKSSTITGYDGSLAKQRICTAEGSTANTALVDAQQDGDLAAVGRSAPRFPTSSTAWCGSSSARWTPW